MLFRLIKNEFIKLLSKAKTWIVFVLFVAFIGINIYSQYQGDKHHREFNAPENRLQMSKQELEYINQEIKDLEGQGSKTNPEYAEYLVERKQTLESNIIAYEEMIKSGSSENAWKLKVEEEIKDTEEYIKNLETFEDEYSKQELLNQKASLEELKYLLDNNIAPIYNWEYQIYGFMGNLMEFLALAILLCGIAVFMSDIVSGECTPATLKFLLVQPVSRGKVLLSKFIAVVITVLVMILGAETLGMLFIKFTGTVDGGSYPVRINVLYKAISTADGGVSLEGIAGSGYMTTNFDFLVKSMLFQGLFIFTGCTVVFMISTLIKSSMITMAISVISTVFITISCLEVSALKKVSHLIFVNYADAMSLYNGGTALQFQNANMSVKTGIIVMVVTSVIAYTIAHINFNKKDILI